MSLVWKQSQTTGMPCIWQRMLNCGIMNHYTRVCKKRGSPKSSPNKSPSYTRRPQSPRYSQFRSQRSSTVNKVVPEFDQMNAIRNLQEQLNQIYIHLQRQVNVHSLRTTPTPTQLCNNGIEAPPPFFISRKEANRP